MIRIMFIIPYEAMEQEIAQLLTSFPCGEPISYQCALYTHLDLEAGHSSWPCDIIVARGYSADVLAAQQTEIPVIKINFSSTDAINAIQVCRERFGSQKIAIIGHPSLAVASATIHSLCDIPIDIYTMEGTKAEIPKLVHTALQNGNDTIIGGGTACQYAESLHVNNYNAPTNPETLYNAIRSAVQTVQIQRQERVKNKTLQTIMDTSDTGFLLTDAAGVVKICNQFVEKLFRATSQEMVGRQFSRILPEFQECFANVLQTQLPAENEIFRRAGKIYTANIVPISIDGTVDSVFIDCRDISSIQEAESQIRKKLFTKGMVTRYQFDDIIHRNLRMQNLIENAREFAAVDSNVLICGETGTGKELFAQSIHAASPRANRPFIAINCAAIPESLLESEMFGYTGGSFTGAAREGKRGFFELAHNGTLFLDEISEVPYSFQGKLLRVLQEQEIRRIGDDRVIPVDVRIIAATNQNLEDLVSQNKFRRDLYFRLNVLSLYVPPLRQRTEDIPPIFQSFLHTYAIRFGKGVPELPDQAYAVLQDYPWLGNIRELRNVAERFMVLYREGCDMLQVLSSSIFPSQEYSALPTDPRPSHEQSEREQICAALQAAGSREAAAAQLGVSRSTLWRKMRQYHLL